MIGYLEKQQLRLKMIKDFANDFSLFEEDDRLQYFFEDLEEKVAAAIDVRRVQENLKNSIDKMGLSYLHTCFQSYVHNVLGLSQTHL